MPINHSVNFLIISTLKAKNKINTNSISHLTRSKRVLLGTGDPVGAPQHRTHAYSELVLCIAGDMAAGRSV